MLFRKCLPEKPPWRCRSLQPEPRSKTPPRARRGGPGRRARKCPNGAGQSFSPSAAIMPDLTYCDRLQQDTAFLTSSNRLSEHLVDRIILQLNRVYPQILNNKEAEKLRNPKASLHSRLSNLIAHLQKKGDRPCQEFYRALQINAEQLYNNLPSRRVLKTSDPTRISLEKEKYMLNDRGPTFFLACFSVAAGLAFFMYWNPDSKVLGGAKKVLGFSPIIIQRHVRKICMLYLEDLSRKQ